MRTFLLALMVMSAVVKAEIYQPPLLESHWHFQGGKLSCRLSQEIPHLGRAVMAQSAGEPLEFGLLLSPGSRVVAATVTITPAPWQHMVLSGKPFPAVMTHERNGQSMSLSVHGDTAEQMLAALFAGHYPSFTLRNGWQGGLSESRVGVSSVRFWEHYDAFQRCRQQLPAFGLKDFQDLAFYFKEHQNRLPRELSEILEKIARYLRLSGKGQVVVRNLASQVSGKEGETWFGKRYALIRKSLLGLGLGKGQITLRPRRTRPTIELSLLGPEGLRIIHYGRRQTALRPSQKRRLALLARYIREFHPAALVIHGHSDGARWRSEKASRALSQRWAEKVRDFLVRQGIPREHMKIRVWGSKRRAASNMSRKGQAINRRVVIELLDRPLLTAARD